MTTGHPVTETQKRFSRTVQLRRWFFVLFILVVITGLVALGTAVVGYFMFQRTFGVTYLDNIEKHFKHGSIGAELANGLPYRVFMALPEIFPEHFGETGDYREFGLIYEKDSGVPYIKGEKIPEDQRLPIGIATGYRNSIEVAWFNCAICHTGLVQKPGEATPEIVSGMPANTVDLERLFLALFEMAVDKDFSWQSEKFRNAINSQGGGLSFLEEFLWEWMVIPQTRAGLLDRRNRLLPLLRPKEATKIGLSVQQSCQVMLKAENGCEAIESKPYPSYRPKLDERVAKWGPGRVDTFNPYKLIHFNFDADCLRRRERIGVTDFPSIFQQKERGDRGMHLHWDGNNASLKERNLSAALGAGATELTVNHGSIEKVAEWLQTLKPEPSPYLADLDKARLKNGREIYEQNCASCHGYHDLEKGYVFEGARLGRIEDIAYINTDPARLSSYTIEMETYQKKRFFCRQKQHRFHYFKKTNGYANVPLDGLWLRAPYLHNGSVPTLGDLLEPAENRPETFVRGLIELDAKKGGFRAPVCDPSIYGGPGFCFDTTIEGNKNQGHEYGTTLSAQEKRDLLTYLKSF